MNEPTLTRPFYYRVAEGMSDSEEVTGCEEDLKTPEAVHNSTAVPIVLEHHEWLKKSISDNTR